MKDRQEVVAAIHGYGEKYIVFLGDLETNESFVVKDRSLYRYTRGTGYVTLILTKHRNVHSQDVYSVKHWHISTRTEVQLAWAARKK